MTIEFTSYELRLKGLLYCGVKGSTTIHFQAKPTAQQVADAQGDFQRVTSARLVEINTTKAFRTVQAA